MQAQHPRPNTFYSFASPPTGAEYPRGRHCMASAGNLLGLDDGIFHRAEALVVGVDVKSAPGLTTYHAPPSSMMQPTSQATFFAASPHNAPNMVHHEQYTLPPHPHAQFAPYSGYSITPMQAHHPALGSVSTHSLSAVAAASSNRSPLAGTSTDPEADPRELEGFAEHFKQRRIKLGVTQADVGKALANLKLPGVGSLSQSTICRFESLTLSHNNMIALRPILEAWLDEAEKGPRDDKKRKRTSIPACEKRSLEAFFRIQPRPSSEKIAAIADQLDLKKGVVRVWFCNRRQKEKRLRSQSRI